MALRQQADEDDQPVELIGGDEGVSTGEGTLSERRDLGNKSSLFSCLGTMGGRLCREVSVPWLSTWNRCNTRGLTTFFRGVLEKKMLKLGRRQCRVGGMNTRLSWAG